MKVSETGDLKLIYQFRILKGLIYPKRSFFQLEKAETVYGLHPKIWLLFLISALVFGISGFVGIGSHVFSSKLTEVPNEEFEWLKIYFVSGRLILGFLYAALIIFFQALWFWTLTDVPYTKLVALQAFVFPIFLFEQVVNIVLAAQMNLPWFSSPFSMGPAAQHMTEKPFLIYFLGCISLFKIWAISIQLYGLRILSSRSPVTSFFITLGMHVIFWLGTAILALLDFNKIL
ncbi:hypothetical protein [Siminovitchia fordii]|uniref:hypothetical protein n=1 Tax=Siminovitchia fordii TaxID=254759 RepID=UPI0012B539BC|nr:hypothetical protein [Siminovitchia fordii]